MPNVSEIQNQVSESVKKGQEAVSGAVKNLGDSIDKIVPEVKIPFADQLPQYIPTAKSAVNTAFDVAEQAVTRNREFVIGILDAVENRLAGEKKAKATPKKTAEQTASA